MTRSRQRSVVGRFHEKYVKHESGCWLWSGKEDDEPGYLWDGSTMVIASRFSYQLFRGPIPDEMYVLHTCDIRRCVNPEHLFLGTQVDNMADMVAKGRANKPKGMENGRAKLTDNDVRFIRFYYRPRSKVYGRDQLARMFGVSEMTIYEILNREKWAHVLDYDPSDLFSEPPIYYPRDLTESNVKDKEPKHAAIEGVSPDDIF
jgi:hypothetical protein